jgi:hypothetical protein
MSGSSHVGRETGSELGFTLSNINELSPIGVHFSAPAGRIGSPTVTSGSLAGRFYLAGRRAIAEQDGQERPICGHFFALTP